MLISYTMRDKILVITLALAIVLFAGYGCGKKEAGSDKLLAKVSNKTITLKDFNARTAKLPPYYQKIIENNKKRYLDELIVEMLLYEEAVREGLDRDKEIRDVLNEAKKKILVAKLIKNEVEDKVKVTESQMKDFYEAHKSEFKTPELWRASHILVANEREAKDIQDSLAKGESFEELARTHSIDATASRGGDVGYFRMGQLIPDFEKACMNLKVGETSGIVHTQFGYHLIKLTDRKGPDVESYEKTKRAIETELKREKRSELFDALVVKLKKKYGVDIKEDIFKAK